MEKRTFTVRRKLTSGPRKFRAWADWKLGDVVVGTYKREVANQFNAAKPNYAIEVEEAFFESDKDLASSLKGVQLVLNNCGMLDKAIKDNEVQVGEIIQVTYTGKGTIENGPYKGKESHTVQVDIVEASSKGEDLL